MWYWFNSCITGNQQKNSSKKTADVSLPISGYVLLKTTVTFTE